MTKRLLALISLLALSACSSEPAPSPNILLISVDTLRWDYLATYGFPESDISPAMDRLAAKGVVYDNAVSVAGTTIPAHSSMFTGLYPRVHGARSNFFGMHENVRTVTQDLKEAGYQTGAFMSNQFLVNIAGLGVGFDATNTPFKDKVRGRRPQLGDKTISQAEAWLDTIDTTMPTFMFLHLWEPHGPYDPTNWSKERLADIDNPYVDGVTLDHIRVDPRGMTENEENVRVMRTLYAGEVNLADQYLDRLLQRLEDSGWLDNAVVILTADHGQTLGENGVHGHGPTLRETVIRIPMIVADFRDPQPGRSEVRVSNVDVAATIAEAAGLDRAYDFVGRSLLNPDALADDWPYFSEVALRQSTDRNWERVKDSKSYDPDAVGVYTGNYKMTYTQGHYFLWDTQCAEIEGCMLDTETDPILADYLQGLIDGFHAMEIDMSQSEVSEEDLRILQGLGYTQ